MWNVSRCLRVLIININIVETCNKLVGHGRRHGQDLGRGQTSKCLLGERSNRRAGKPTEVYTRMLPVTCSECEMCATFVGMAE